jgi:cell wall-associated NlpC family hydrolase
MNDYIFKYLSIPYIESGRTFEGCDCWGLVSLYYREELNIPLAEYVVADSFSQVQNIEANDILLFNNGCAHVGVAISDTEFLHMLENIGVSVSKISLWRPKLIAAYRHKSC